MATTAQPLQILNEIWASRVFKKAKTAEQMKTIALSWRYSR